MHIDRHKVPYVLPGDYGKWFIAYGTAGKREGRRAAGKCGQYLPHLFAHVIAHNKDVVRSKGPLGESGVSCQDYAVFFERTTDDVVVIERPVIKYIESPEPHPLREPAQHDIGDKLHRNLRQPRRHEGAKKS